MFYVSHWIDLSVLKLKGACTYIQEEMYVLNTLLVILLLVYLYLFIMHLREEKQQKLATAAPWTNYLYIYYLSAMDIHEPTQWNEWKRCLYETLNM